jgi:hypothetical protein
MAGALLALSCLAGSLRAQQKTSEVLHNAARCLMDKGFFPSSKDEELRLASVLDKESYQHLVAAIMRMEAQPTFTIDVNDLRSASVSVACESYADRK